MSPAISNHLWQSTLFALAVALLTLGFRRNSARVRYWLWWSASIKFLLPVTLLISAASHMEVAPVAKLMPPEAASTVILEVSQPFSSTPASTAPSIGLWTFAWLVWAAGTVCLAGRRIRGYLRVRGAVRSATPLGIEGSIEVRSTTARLEPGIAGFLHPVLLLPAGIAERLTPRQYESILAHEMCHARWRDNLTAAVHMSVETVFWFHPFVWWIGARLLQERERACDEAVIAAGGEPRDYADAIVNVCRFYAESPLACVPGVSGSDVKQRLQSILSGAAVRELSGRQKMALLLAALAAAGMPIVAGIAGAGALRGQVPSGSRKFDVASVRPCRTGEADAGRKTERKRGVTGPQESPGRLLTGCETVEELIRSAYILYATGRLVRDPLNPPLEGGPPWIRSERYQIQATAEGAPGTGTMNGPLMRALLEERFRLKIRRESREVPVYAMTVVRGGPRLIPFQPGSCTVVDSSAMDRAAAQNPCRALIRKTGPNLTMEGRGSTITELAKLLHLIVDRPVMDRTGIEGRFDFMVEFAPEERPAVFRPAGEPIGPPLEPVEEPTAPRVFAAFEKQLGIKLEPARGPREYVVIEHVERPSKN